MAVPQQFSKPRGEIVAVNATIYRDDFGLRPLGALGSRPAFDRAFGQIRF
jgi:hypothetical protein